MHYKLLENYSNIFDSIHIIITLNNDLYNNSDILYRIKSKLISIIHNNNLEISYEINDPRYREGIIYKKYVYDQLENYRDSLIFFGHTKGVTNPMNMQYIENTKLWIFSLYYLNLRWMDEVKRKLVDDPNYIFYGGLYFKDYRHNNVNNWFYSGSFYWINPDRLLNYTKENNTNLNRFFRPENERLMRCAELFVGCVPYTHAAFHWDEKYNKEHELFHLYGNELSYKYVDEQVRAYLNIWEYDELKINMGHLFNE